MVDVDWKSFRKQDDKGSVLLDIVAADDGEIIGETVDEVEKIDVFPHLANLLLILLYLMLLFVDFCEFNYIGEIRSNYLL